MKTGEQNVAQLQGPNITPLTLLTLRQEIHDSLDHLTASAGLLRYRLWLLVQAQGRCVVWNSLDFRCTEIWLMDAAMPAFVAVKAALSLGQARLSFQC